MIPPTSPMCTRWRGSGGTGGCCAVPFLHGPVPDEEEEGPKNAREVPGVFFDGCCAADAHGKVNGPVRNGNFSEPSSPHYAAE